MAAQSGPAKKRARLEPVASVPAAEAITFHLAGDLRSSGGDLRPSCSFKPEMCHQLFGEEESITGGCFEHSELAQRAPPLACL